MCPVLSPWFWPSSLLINVCIEVTVSHMGQALPQTSQVEPDSFVSRQHATVPFTRSNQTKKALSMKSKQIEFREDRNDSSHGIYMGQHSQGLGFVKISKTMKDTGRTSETHFFSENKGVAEIAEFLFNFYVVCLNHRLPFQNLALLSLILLLQQYTKNTVTVFPQQQVPWKHFFGVLIFPDKLKFYILLVAERKVVETYDYREKENTYHY